MFDRGTSPFTNLVGGGGGGRPLQLLFAAAKLSVLCVKSRLYWLHCWRSCNASNDAIEYWLRYWWRPMSHLSSCNQCLHTLSSYYSRFGVENVALRREERVVARMQITRRIVRDAGMYRRGVQQKNTRILCRVGRHYKKMHACWISRRSRWNKKSIALRDRKSTHACWICALSQRSLPNKSSNLF